MCLFGESSSIIHLNHITNIRTEFRHSKNVSTVLLADVVKQHRLQRCYISP